ncbi:MAG: two pore domain potassium channel family protein [Ruminococcus sp.]|uniref:potassium channel family protein n=1 Tax=Ruminococcus sp. TaxID=41978 RepID=UPI0028739F57|nr:potassium channel family protein [Ruminococcus sp.]MBQ3284413.1 two pore domain potassium channel family protein [Ruminococcus sp.]
MMKAFRRIGKVLIRTGAIKIFMGYLVILLIGGALISFIEPQVHGVFEGFYFCFVASTTIGFGDIVPITLLGRIITIIVTLFGVLTVAMVPGAVVAYYTEYLKIREKDTVSTFLEELENLPEKSKEELADISERVKKFNRGK